MLIANITGNNIVFLFIKMFAQLVEIVKEYRHSRYILGQMGVRVYKLAIISAFVSLNKCHISGSSHDFGH
jgi:hypothetical protein